jgi:hypothetical protein
MTDRRFQFAIALFLAIFLLGDGWAALAHHHDESSGQHGDCALCQLAATSAEVVDNISIVGVDVNAQSVFAVEVSFSPVSFPSPRASRAPPSL